MRIATYNVHGLVGVDRRFRPDRTLEVLRRLKPQVLALQEVILPKKGENLLQGFARELQMNFVFAPTLETSSHYYGNALLTGYPVIKSHVHNLSVRGKEPRNLLEVTLQGEKGLFNVLLTHLGLSAWERRRQFLKIFRVLDPYREGGDPLFLLGDFNQIRYPPSLMQKILMFFKVINRAPTFPAYFPLLSLDQIWSNLIHQHIRYQVYRTFLSLMSSDHLPLLMDVGSWKRDAT